MSILIDAEPVPFIYQPILRTGQPFSNWLIEIQKQLGDEFANLCAALIPEEIFESFLDEHSHLYLEILVEASSLLNIELPSYLQQIADARIVKKPAEELAAIPIG